MGTHLINALPHGIGPNPRINAIHVQRIAGNLGHTFSNQKHFSRGFLCGFCGTMLCVVAYTVYGYYSLKPQELASIARQKGTLVVVVSLLSFLAALVLLIMCHITKRQASMPLWIQQQYPEPDILQYPGTSCVEKIDNPPPYDIAVVMPATLPPSYDNLNKK